MLLNIAALNSAKSPHNVNLNGCILQICRLCTNFHIMEMRHVVRKKMLNNDNTYCMSESNNSRLAVFLSLVLSKGDIAITTPITSTQTTKTGDCYIQFRITVCMNVVSDVYYVNNTYLRHYLVFVDAEGHQ